MMRFIGRATLGLVYAACLLVAIWVLIELAATLVPPRPDAHAHGAVLRLERGRQHVLLLEGDPYALGFYNVLLTTQLLRRQEDTLLDLLFGFARGPGRAMVIRELSLLYLTGIGAYLTPAERQEILGLTHGSADPFPDLGPRYTRLTAYHAIHELSQRFATDNPSVGCSLMAVGSARSIDGHALLARNFDFEGGEVFDLDKMVLAVKPRSGFGFVSVAWAGMAGVVSGINEAGLVIVINAGASREYRRVGAPTSLLVRRALERAATLEEAVAVLTEEPRFVTDIIGLAEASGRVAVLELLPESFALRTDDLLVATNHLESPGLSDDPTNLAQMRRTTTVPRHQRLEAIATLDHATDGPRRIPLSFGVDELLTVLRDRYAHAGQRLLPLGHRHALDALIATHSVIFDATARRIWVSEGPHTLGPYHGYDVRALVRAANETEAKMAFLPDLPADPMLAAYPRVAQARLSWKLAERALAADDLDRADATLRRAALLADHPATLRLAAEVATRRGDLPRARELLRRALAAPPEFADESRRIEAARAELEVNSLPPGP